MQLTVDPNLRLGIADGGLQTLKAHAYFADFEWDLLERGSMDAPLTATPIRPKKVCYDALTNG